MAEFIYGIIAALVIIAISKALKKYFTTSLMASTILIAIAFIYVGFSLKDNTVYTIALESSVALILYFVAIIGYTKKPILAAAGIIFHGVWDILHHNNLLVTTNMPVYWPSFCFIIDIIDGVYFCVIIKKEKIL